MEERSEHASDVLKDTHIHPRTHERRKVSPRIWVYTAIAGCLSFGVIIFFSGLCRVEHIEWRRGGGGEDTIFTPSRELAETVESLLEKKRFFFVPKRNFFIISPSDIQRQLGIFPSYRVHDVIRRFPDTLIIYIEPKLRFSYIVQEYKEQRVMESIRIPPSSLDMAQTQDQQKKEEEQGDSMAPEIFEPQFVKVQKFFRISEQGVLGEEISRADISTERPSMKLITSRPLVAGEKIISEHVWDFMTQVYDGFEQITTIPIEAFEMGEELLPSEIRVVTTEGWIVAFDSAYSLADQMTRLELLLKQQIKEKRPTLRSIDLRIPGKVFYE